MQPATQNHGKLLLQGFLWIGAFFYFFEFVLHTFGLQILEHDKIFLYTHDRYIALFALTYAALLVLVSTDVLKYTTVFILTIVGMFLSFLNGWYVSIQGGYAPLFHVATLDGQLASIGYLFLLWYFGLIILGYLVIKERKAK